jgi:muramidase (phage lysozyme)
MDETQQNLLDNPNVRQFLDFLGKAEGADYDVIVGGGRFDDFSAHPGVVGLRTKEGPSTAAGKYQITKTTFDDIAPRLGVTDFSPASQDRVALALIDRRGALDKVVRGDFEGAIKKLGKEWASLPSSTYRQPKRSWDWARETLAALAPQEGSPEGDSFSAPSPRMARAAKARTGRTQPVEFAELPDNYRAALAANYLADTTDEKEDSVVEQALMLADGAGAGGSRANSYLQAFMQPVASDPFQFLRQEEQEPRTTEQRRRPVPRMPQAFADGGSVSKSGVNRLKQARAVPAMARFQDGGEVEQMTVGTLPEDQVPAGEALANIRRDLVRGAQYLPYDLLGAPVDIINLGLTPFGLGSEKPVGGAEWLIDKSRKAGIADEPTYSAPEMVSRVGMGFVNPATVAKYAPQGIAALRRTGEKLELPGIAQTAPVGAINPRSGVDTSVLLPKENKPFIGQVERMAADLPGPVTKEQFLNQVKKQGRNYEINRLEQALENLPGNAKLTPQEIIDRLAPTSPSRFTMEIIPPGTKRMYDTSDNPFESIKPGAVNLLLDIPPQQKQVADIAERGERLVDDLSRYSLLRPVTDMQRMPETDFLRNPPISMAQKIEPMIPAVQELGDITGKDVTKIIRSMQSIAERGDDLNAINMQRAKLAYPALTAKWDTYANMPKEQLPAQLKDNWGYLDTDKLVASIYDDAIEGIRSSIKNASFFKADDFADELQALESFAAWNNQFKLNKATFQQITAEANTAERILTDRLDMFTEPLKSQADRLGNNVYELVKELPTAHYRGTHEAVVNKNPISFSRFVEFTPNKADELGISMPDQDRGVIMYLELQSDRQKALRLGDNVEEAFPV